MFSQKYNTFPKQQNIKLKVSSQICHCDCRETPSTPRNQILHLTVRATQGDLAKLATRSDLILSWHTLSIRTESD